MSTVVHHVEPSTTPRPSGPRTVRYGVRRIGLGVFFASVAVNAALGIYAVLAPDFGETQEKILVTSLCVTGAVLMALCCEPAWERRLLGPVPYAGAILGTAAFAMTIAAAWSEADNETAGKILGSTFTAAIACTLASVVVLERARKRISLGHKRVITLTLGVIALDAALVLAPIWTEPSGDTARNLTGTCLVAAAACVLAALLTLPRPSRSGTRRVIHLTLGVIALASAVAVALIWTTPSDDTVGNFAGTFWVAAVACGIAAFLTLARLAPGHRRALAATFALLALGAALVVANIWVPDTSELTRAMGVVLIAFAAFAVTVPVLHWLDRGAMAVAAATSDAVRFCPHCGRKLAGEIDTALECGRCGRGFSVSSNAST